MTQHNGILVVHLPKLKEFTFGWKAVDLGCRILQIWSSCLTISPAVAQTGFGVHEGKVLQRTPRPEGNPQVSAWIGDHLDESQPGGFGPTLKDADGIRVDQVAGR